ncbi:hypothetical protein [Silicimonas algicola]|uniref:hypothetical protein n=1 Tax=Silicimonas algicola TaxID=1826607 RepID=UPI0013DF8491|nr:hypothetical protein [Silicimonas algicola]
MEASRIVEHVGKIDKHPDRPAQIVQLVLEALDVGIVHLPRHDRVQRCRPFAVTEIDDLPRDGFHLLEDLLIQTRQVFGECWSVCIVSQARQIHDRPIGPAHRGNQFATHFGRDQIDHTAQVRTKEVSGSGHVRLTRLP